MSMPQAPRGDRIERPPQALTHRFDVDSEFTPTTSGGQMRDTKLVECLQLDPLPLRLPVGTASELDQTRLLRMERQAKLLEPLRQHFQHFLRIFAMLEKQGSIIRVTDFKCLALQPRFHFLLEPFIQNDMKVHVGEQRTDNLSLSRPRVAHEQSSLIDHPGGGPRPGRAQGAGITNPPLDHRHEMLSDNRIEI